MKAEPPIRWAYLRAQKMETVPKARLLLHIPKWKMKTTRIGSVCSAARMYVRARDVPESFAQPQQVLSTGLESDAHVVFAVALMGAIVFA